MRKLMVALQTLILLGGVVAIDATAKDVVMRKPGHYRMSMKDEKDFILQYDFSIKCAYDEGLQITKIKLHSKAFLSHWKVIVFYPGGEIDTFLNYKMGSPLEIQTGLCSLEAGESVKIEVINSGPGTKFRAEIDAK